MVEAPATTRNASFPPRLDPGWLVLPAVLLTVWRAFVAPGDRLLGHALSEGPAHLWMQWLLERALFDGAAWVGQEDVILGTPLWVVPNDPLNRLVSVPLGWLLGENAAFDICAVSLLALAALSVIRLARQLGATPWPSTLAGLLVLWSPALLGYAADGRIDSMSLGWLVLLVSAWISAMRSPSWRAGLGLGATAVLVILAGFNIAVVALLCLAIPTLIAVALQRARLRPLVVCLALALPPTLLMGAAVLGVGRDGTGRLSPTWLDGPERIYQPLDSLNLESARTWAGAWFMHRQGVQEFWEVPDLVHERYTRPGPYQGAMLTILAPGAWWRLPWTSVALLALGLLRRRRAVWALGVVALVAQLLAAGHGSAHMVPISIGGAPFFVAPAVLFRDIPLLSSFTAYGLFAGVAAVAFACGAALALTELRGGWLIGAIALGAWLVEVQTGPVPLPLPATEVGCPDALLPSLAGLGAREAVMVVPINHERNGLLQTCHGHPGVLRFWQQRGVTPAWPKLADPDGTLSRFLVQVSGAGALEPGIADDLHARGVGAVVVLPGLLADSVREGMILRTTEVLGAPRHRDEQLIVFRLDQPGGSGLGEAAAEAD